jgi:hypothetical protein
MFRTPGVAGWEQLEWGGDVTQQARTVPALTVPECPTGTTPRLTRSLVPYVRFKKGDGKNYRCCRC